MKLRYYQEESITSIYQYFSKHPGTKEIKNPIVALPTGTGKTVVIAGFLKSAFHYYPNQKILILTHVSKLIEQNYEKLMLVWPQAPAGVFSAGLAHKYERDLMSQIVFAGIQSIYKQAEAVGHVDIVIIDEAHLVGNKEGSMYNTFLGNLIKINPYMRVIGLTATPWKLGIGHLTQNGIFTDVCVDYTSTEKFNKLIKDGYLCKLIPKQTNMKIDISEVGLKGGEFKENELQQAVNKEAITRKAIEETVKTAKDREHWLVFTTGIDHAKSVANMLDIYGIPTGVVHSKLNQKSIDSIIAAHERGEIKALVNVDMLTTGYDSPFIDLIVVLRPTMSPGLWVQMLGRGTRPCAGKIDCLVLDFAGNTSRLGPINNPVIPLKRKKGNLGTAPVKTCPTCRVYNHATAKFCTECNTEFTFQTKITETASTNELIAYELPEYKIYEVNHITYAVHKKQNKPDSLRVTYYSKLRMFNEWIHFESGPFLFSAAQAWWRKRDRVGYMPNMTAEAIMMIDNLITPKFIKVWINREYPEIVDYIFEDNFKVNNEIAK